MNRIYLYALDGGRERRFMSSGNVMLPKRSCSVLTLPMKGKWFDMIDSGVKREEYRGLDYWGSRVFNWFERFENDPLSANLVVSFQRGHQKPSMSFLVTDVSFVWTCRHRRIDWGEPKGPHITISLGCRAILT